MKILAFIFMLIGAISLVPFFALLLPILSGIAAVIIGWAFPFTTDTIRELAGIQLTDFQLGATLGFFGSFFRSTNFNNND